MAFVKYSELIKAKYQFMKITFRYLLTVTGMGFINIKGKPGKVK
jgi:hypothetical protein